MMTIEYCLEVTHADEVLEKRLTRKRESYMIRYEGILQNMAYLSIFKYFNMNERQEDVARFKH